MSSTILLILTALAAIISLFSYWIGVKTTKDDQLTTITRLNKQLSDNQKQINDLIVAATKLRAELQTTKTKKNDLEIPTKKQPSSSTG